MGTAVSVKTENMKIVAQTIATKVAKLEGVVTTLNSQLKQLDNCWEGGSKEAFRTAMLNDINEINKFIAEANDYKNSLSSMARAYESVENTNKAKLAARSYKK